MTDRRTVAVLSPGEMGSQVGRALRSAGTTVVTCIGERSAATRARAAAAGFELTDTLDDLVRRAHLVISVVPSLSALPLADSVAAAMARTGSRPTYLDANSIGPSTARKIEASIAGVGAVFVDGSIIGGASTLTKSATVYLSGEASTDVVGLLEPLRIEVIGTAAGQASGFKVLYAGLTKGLSALGVELLAGAARLGLQDRLLEKYQESQPSVARFFNQNLPGLPPRSARRAEEMIELSETLDELGLPSNMSKASQRTLETLAQRHREAAAPSTDDLETMLAWLDGQHDGTNSHG
ncbi:MAG: 6-phosphogluconate dehydrogenase, NAD-binding [Chloroflexi bacterium]|nr:6-phosphogluconate dehydrogenase, NAD-binding [Chloroflexota bacterium]